MARAQPACVEACAERLHPLMRRLGITSSGAPLLLLVPVLVAVPVVFVVGYYLYM
jgi:hypothetical protein